MASLDIDDLFSNIPLDKTFDINVKKLFKLWILWLKEDLEMIFMIY